MSEAAMSAEASKVPFLEITDLEIDGNRLRASFAYRVEGVVGVATFNEVEGKWRKQAVEVIEQ